MDKDFWVSIAQHDYKIPEGHSPDELTKALFGYLGSTDPGLRDDIAYIVYANFLKRDLYTIGEVHSHVDELLANLEQGIGESGTDSVFLRAFSVLLPAEIVHIDNKKELFGKEQVLAIFEKGLWYLEAEKDPRGFVPVKGWAHALAHTADLMLVLGRSRHVETSGLERILQGIARKLVMSTDWVYIHGEDERLANAVTAVSQRGIVTNEFWENLLGSLTQPERPWKGAYLNEEQAMAYHNVRNFLRSAWNAVRSANEAPRKAELETAILEAHSNLKPY